MNCMSMDSITEVFYRLNIMLIATKHIADNKFAHLAGTAATATAFAFTRGRQLSIISMGG